MSSDEEEEELLYEFDVIALPIEKHDNLSTKRFIYELDFPTLPTSNVLSHNATQARYKKQVQELEIGVPYNKSSTSYDSTRANMIIEGAASKIGLTNDPASLQRFSGRVTSSPGTSESDAVGTLIGSMIFLRPVTNTIQMRPNIHYLGHKSAEKKKKNDDIYGSNSDDAPSSTQPPTKKPATQSTSAVRVKFQREIQNQAVKKRRMMTERRRWLAKNDPWITLRLNSVLTLDAKKEFFMLFRLTTQLQNYQLNTLIDSFKQLISYKPMPENYCITIAASSQLEKFANTETPLVQSVCLVMERVHAISLPMLLQLLPRGSHINEVIEILKPISTLIQGNFVLLSERIYNENSVSGIVQRNTYGKSKKMDQSFDRYQLARDLVLSHYARGDSVNFKKILDQTHVYSSKLFRNHMMLISLIIEVPNAGTGISEKKIAFRLKPDLETEKMLPDLTTHCNNYWQTIRINAIKKRLAELEEQLSQSKNENSIEAQKISGGQQRRNSYRNNFHSPQGRRMRHQSNISTEIITSQTIDLKPGTETPFIYNNSDQIKVEAACCANTDIPIDRKQIKLHSSPTNNFEQCGQNEKAAATNSTSSSSKPIKTDEILVSPMLIEAVGEQAYRMIKNYILSLFRQNPVRSIAELKEHLILKSKESSEDEAGMFGHEAFTFEAIEQIAQEVKALWICTDSVFHRAIPNRLYAIVEGASNNHIRRQLVSFLIKKSRFRLKTFKDLVAKDNDNFDDDLIKKVVCEYCTYKSGVYRVRGLDEKDK